jgi:hypothetical protein
MSRYAQNTTVAPDRSRAEIEKILSRYGATRFASGWDRDCATLAFEANGRRVRFVLKLPKVEEFERTERGRKRAKGASLVALKAEERRRWRALALVVKAKLEAVSTGVSTFDDEFLAHFVLPNGETVGQWAAPQLAHAFDSKKMPPLLGS